MEGPVGARARFALLALLGDGLACVSGVITVLVRTPAGRVRTAYDARSPLTTCSLSDEMARASHVTPDLGGFCQRFTAFFFGYAELDDGERLEVTALGTIIMFSSPSTSTLTKKT